MFSHIPKHFLTDVFVGPGPWGKKYAKPCFCGRPIDMEEDNAILTSESGSVMICHMSCVKGREPDAEV